MRELCPDDADCTRYKDTIINIIKSGIRLFLLGARTSLSALSRRDEKFNWDSGVYYSKLIALCAQCGISAALRLKLILLCCISFSRAFQAESFFRFAQLIDDLQNFLFIGRLAVHNIFAFTH